MDSPLSGPHLPDSFPTQFSLEETYRFNTVECLADFTAKPLKYVRTPDPENYVSKSMYGNGCFIQISCLARDSPPLFRLR